MAETCQECLKRTAVQMLRLSVDMDLTVTALLEANRVLLQKTSSPPIGLVVGLGTEGDMLSEILARTAESLGHLNVAVLKHFPQDAWILYNNTHFVATSGA